MDDEFVKICQTYFALDNIRKSIDEVILKNPDMQTRQDVAEAGNAIWRAMKRLNAQAKAIQYPDTYTIEVRE